MDLEIFFVLELEFHELEYFTWNSSSRIFIYLFIFNSL